MLSAAIVSDADIGDSVGYWWSAFRQHYTHGPRRQSQHQRAASSSLDARSSRVGSKSVDLMWSCRWTWTAVCGRLVVHCASSVVADSQRRRRSLRASRISTSGGSIARSECDPTVSGGRDVKSEVSTWLPVIGGRLEANNARRKQPPIVGQLGHVTTMPMWPARLPLTGCTTARLIYVTVMAAVLFFVTGQSRHFAPVSAVT